MDPLVAQAKKNIGDIIHLATKHDLSRQALVIFDNQTPLSRLVAAACRVVLPAAKHVDFDTLTQEEVMAQIALVPAGGLVILVQSSNFRLDAFRIRIELFKRGLAVIEHIHLERAVDAKEMEIYIDALAYDQSYYMERGHALKKIIDQAQTITVRCAGTTLVYEGGMEATKLNIGDYAGMKNIGGTFPIGEVFSEPKDFSQVNGEVMLFAFASTDHIVRIVPAFKVRIERGIITSHQGPPEFEAVLDQIRSEEAVLVREFGLGLNPAMGKSRVLSDITAFERQKGLHLSLGEKHGIYKKPGLHQKKTHFHIDVFVDIEAIEVDGQTLFL